MNPVPIKVSAFCAAVIFGLSSALAVPQQNDAEALNAKGLELYKQGKFEEAIKSYKEALKLRKDYAEAHLNLGDALVKSGQYKKAVDAYKQALRYRPDWFTAINNMGTAYHVVGEHKKAVEAFKEAIRVEPKSSLAIFNLGAAYAARDRKQEALAQYQVLKTLDQAAARKLFVLIYKPVAAVFRDATGVRLNVRVTDAQGNHVASLNQDDFQVFEDNVPQVISSFSGENFPIVYGLAIDTSGSMRAAFAEAIEVAKAIIRGSQPEDDALLIRFISSDKIETVQEFTSDKNQMLAGLETLYVEEGQSAIIDAVYLTAQHTAQHKIDGPSYLRRVVILITDGDERASFYDLKNLVSLLHQIDVQVFAICLGKVDPKATNLNQVLARSAEPLLKTLTRETGGRAFFPKTVSELEALVQQLMAMIRTQYLLSYKPTTPAEAGAYRGVSVTLASRANLKAQVRSGYVVPDKEPIP